MYYICIDVIYLEKKTHYELFENYAKGDSTT